MKVLVAWMCLVALAPMINALGSPLPGSCRICQRRGMCKPPDCVCCSDRMPFPRRKTPQMVYFTFDDAVASQIIPYYKKLFPPDRFNPNGCPIAMTLFVSDKDTIYSQVKDFYDHGMEIGVHSITHDHLTPETFAQEAQGQKDKLVAAGIPEKSITGWRSPFLEVEGNTQFKNLTYLGFKYDATLSTAQTDARGRSFPIPFTLDYGWPFSCRINDCPTEPHKGFWEVPVVELRMTHDRPCVYVDACPIPWGNQSAASELLWHNFNRYYEGNRAPLGFNMHAGWFYDPTRLKAMDQFIEALSQKDDVYILTISQVIEWLKNPTPLDGIKYFDPWGCPRSRKSIFPEDRQVWKDVHHHSHHNSRVSQPWLQHRDTAQEQQQVAPKQTDPKPQGTRSSTHSSSWWQDHSWLFERKSQPRQEVDQNIGNPPEAKAPTESKRNIVYTIKKKPETDSRSGSPMGGIGRMMGSERSTSLSAVPTPKPRTQGPKPSQGEVDSHSSILWTIGSKVPDTRGKIPSDSNTGQLMKVLFEADLQHREMPQQRSTTAKPYVPKTKSRFPTPEQALTRSFPRSDRRSDSINERMPSGVPENMNINSASTQEVPQQIEQNKQGVKLGPSQEPKSEDSASNKESQKEKLARLKQQLDGLHAKYIDAPNAQGSQVAKANPSTSSQTQVEPNRHIPPQGERQSRPRPSKTERNRQGRDSFIDDQARLDKDYKILDFIEPQINQGSRPSRKMPSDIPEFIFEPIKSKKSTPERRIPNLSNRDIPVSDRPQEHRPDAQMLDSNTNIQATIARQIVDVDPWSNPRMSDQTRDINAGINETPKSTVPIGRSMEELPFLPDHLVDHPRPDTTKTQAPSQTTSSLEASKMTAFRFGPLEPETSAPASSVPRPPLQPDLRVQEPSQRHRTSSADKISFRFGRKESETSAPASGIPQPHQTDTRVQEPSQNLRTSSADKISFRLGRMESETSAPASGIPQPHQTDTRVQEPSQRHSSPNADKMTFRLGRMEPKTNAPDSGFPPPPHHPDTSVQEPSQKHRTNNADSIRFSLGPTEPEMNQASSPDFAPRPPTQSRLPFIPDDYTGSPPQAVSQPKQPAAPALPEIVFRFGNPNDHKNELVPGNIPLRNLEEETRQRERMDAWLKQQQRAAQPEHDIPAADSATAGSAVGERERISDLLSKMKASNPLTNHRQDLSPDNFATQPPDTFDPILHFDETSPSQSPPTQPLSAASSPVDRFMKIGSLSGVNFGKPSALGQPGTLGTDIGPEQSADFNDKLSAFLSSQRLSETNPGAPISPDSQRQEILSVEQPVTGRQSHNGPQRHGAFVDSPTFISTPGIDEMPPVDVPPANQGLLPSVPFNPPATVPPQSTDSYTTEPPYGVCQQDINCFLPDCLCKSVEIPGGIQGSQTPQIVYIVMDGNVNTYMEPKIKSIFDGTRRNPNGCRISGTMFLSHKYSNYTIVQSLSRMGVEIGLAGMQPINNENVSLLKQDIDNQLHNLALYGVDTSKVSGWSSPGLNPKGDEQFRILNRKRFYDSTLLTVDSDQRLLWPFTLDFTWGEPCLIETCPKQPHYGMWEVPIIPLRLDKTNATCKYADSCTLQKMNVLETKDYLWDNFKRYYNSNKAPFGIRIHQFWFHTHFADSLQGLTEFLDEILQLNDVYITSVAKMLDWLQQPTPLSDLHLFPFWMC